MINIMERLKLEGICHNRHLLVNIMTHQVSTDGIEMEGGTDEHKTMPDGMSKWYDSITLEKYNPCSICYSTKSQFIQTRSFFLKLEKE